MRGKRGEQKKRERRSGGAESCSCSVPLGEGLHGASSILLCVTTLQLLEPANRSGVQPAWGTDRPARGYSTASH